MNACIFEDAQVPHLLPLVRTRPVYDLRVGARSLLERLTDTLHEVLDAPSVSLHVRADLGAVTRRAHPDRTVNELAANEEVLFVNGRLAPRDGDELAELIGVLNGNEPSMLVQEGAILAALLPAGRFPGTDGELANAGSAGGVPRSTVEGYRTVDHLWDLIALLPELLVEDVEREIDLRGPRVPEGPVRRTGGAVVEPGRIHCHETATLRPGVILNAENGPIVVDRDAIVMERAVLRGPLYLGPQAQAKIGARLEGSALGTYCKAGGEVEHAIMHAYANKAHEGFLGHSYVAPWCNLAADTNTSNLKNDYGEISVYDVAEEDFVPSGQQFLGMFMGDHSRCGINTMFNTGTVVGVFCNIFGVDYPPRYVPSFSWGEHEFAPYRIEKALEVAERVMARRDVELRAEDATLLRRIFEETHQSPSVRR